MKVSWSEAGHSWYGGHANSVIQMGLSKWLYLGHARTFRGYLRHKYDHGISVWFTRFQCVRVRCGPSYMLSSVFIIDPTALGW